MQTTIERNNNGFYKGIHLYVNIRNLNQVIKKEEKQTDNLRRVFHAMDNYVSTSESFINTYNDEIYVEKLTNSRLHIVFYNTKAIAINFVEIIKFFHAITLKLNNDSKYQKLIDFQVTMGADFGFFTEFDFQSSSNDNYIEYTSIGFPANRAAKLEAVADTGELIISKEAFEIVKSQFKAMLYSPQIEKIQRVNNKYINSEMYSFTAFDKIEISQSYESKYNIANNRYMSNIRDKSFGDIIFTNANKKVDFDNLSLLSPKKVESVVIYADIRGFTKKFNSDGSNLVEMSRLTKDILQKMYKAVIAKDGSHVQFQGDRESALRNDFGEEDHVLKGLQVAMYILEIVINLQVANDNKLQIGIGCSQGTVFAAKVGIRNHKHNLIMGETVKQANEAEDLFAGNNEIAIRKEMYDYLIKCCNAQYRNIIISIFKPKGDFHYITTTTFSEFNDRLFNTMQEGNADEAKHNKAQRPWYDQDF